MKLPSQDPAFVARLLACADAAACLWQHAREEDAGTELSEEERADGIYECVLDNSLDDAVVDWITEYGTP